ncbi:hypothetical protein K445DRAFT_319515 [Daldinia sp. EC12]|nr:hypothetical protein F4774DRAFT_26612 [Daldinia eschscholtzii]OTB13985.1 hypothetical protein K445DRAFT_319515 [Daldinia sp. EC12]
MPLVDGLRVCPLLLIAAISAWVTKGILSLTGWNFLGNYPLFPLQRSIRWLIFIPCNKTPC